MFKKVLCLLPLLALLSACENLPKTTSSGLRYVVHHHDNKARKPKSDEFMMLNVVIKLGADSVLRSTYTQDKHPLPQPAAPDTLKDGGLGEAIAMLAEGDSISFLFNADSMYAKAGQRVPPSLKKGSDITYTFKVEKIITKAQAEQTMQQYQQQAQAEAQKNAITQKAVDEKLITEYLAKNKITNFKKTSSGLVYWITKEGNGPLPEKGSTVVVNYTGKLLDGKVFDTNMRDKDSKPFEFGVGQGQVIPGWDEGLMLITKNSKANLLIPSNIAYGSAASGPIPPNSVLLFEIELLDIKKPAGPPIP